MAPGRTEAGQAGAGRQNYNWQRYASGSASGRSPASNGAGSGFQGRGATGGSPSWQRFASPSPYGGRSEAGQSSRGGWQGYSGQRGYSGGSYGGGSRPSLDLNRPIMRQRAPSSYYGGGRGYSAPSGGNRSYSAPKGNSGGGGHSYSAPKSSGGSGGGGGHASSGGGHRR